jgi:hypothetical protein
MTFKQINTNKWQYKQEDFVERSIEIFKYTQGSFELHFNMAVNTDDIFSLDLDPFLETIYQLRVDEEVLVTTHNYQNLVDFFLKSSKKILCNCENNCPEPTCEDYLKLYNVFTLLFFIPEYSYQIQGNNYQNLTHQLSALTNLLTYNPQAFKKKKVVTSIKIMYSLMLKQALFYSANIEDTKEAWKYQEINECSNSTNYVIL